MLKLLLDFVVGSLVAVWFLVGVIVTMFTVHHILWS